MELNHTLKLLPSKGNHKFQPTDWEKILANDVTDRDLISKIYRQFIQLNNNKTQSTNGAEYLNRHFSKEHMQMAKRHLKRCSASLIYQTNANQNHSEVPAHTSQNGHHEKVCKHSTRERVWRKGNPATLLVGMKIDAAAAEVP